MVRKYAWIFVRGHYLNIFSPQMEAIVFIILQMFFATRVVLKIGGYSQISPSFSWAIFGHVMCLDQSRERKDLMDCKHNYYSFKIFPRF